MTPTVRPIHYTTRTHEWVHLLVALGGEHLLDQGDWQLVALGGGGVAVHGMPDGVPGVPATELRFVVGDLEEALTAVAPALREAGVTTATHEEDFGRYATLAAPDGQRLYLDENADLTATAAGAPLVLPLWYTPDVAGGERVLRALGLAPRISSDSGGWADLTAPGGGLTAVHRDDAAAIALSFEHPDVRALAGRLAQAGVESAVVDESYGYSLRIVNPDAPDDPARRIWVNEAQQDLYGYRRHDPAV